MKLNEIPNPLPAGLFCTDAVLYSSKRINRPPQAGLPSLYVKCPLLKVSTFGQDFQ